MSNGVCEIGESAIHAMTEPECARRRHAEGHSIACHVGRHWERIFSGFWQPVHILARLDSVEATRPSALCWGFRATLDPSASATANGNLPLHLLTDVGGYTAESLGSNQRRALRKCRKTVRILRVDTPDALLAQGYPVVVSSTQRTGYEHLRHLDKPRYEAFVRRVAGDPSYVVLAGFVGETLAGYLVGMAVGDVAYVDDVEIATEYLPTAIGTGLLFDFVQMCRRAPTIRRIVHGLHAAEDPGLTRFKERMRFAIVNVPTRIWVAPGIRQYIRMRYPFKYYRLTGDTIAEPGSAGACAPDARDVSAQC